MGDDSDKLWCDYCEQPAQGWSSTGEYESRRFYCTAHRATVMANPVRAPSPAHERNAVARRLDLSALERLWHKHSRKVTHDRR